MKRPGEGGASVHDGPQLLEDFSEATETRSKRGRRRNHETEGSRKKRKTKETIIIEEIAEEEEEMIDLSSARIKRCDVKVKTEDFSYYLQDLGLGKFDSPEPDPSTEDTSRGPATENEKEEVCEETSNTDSVEDSSQQKEVEAEEACEDDDSLEGWYHGTTGGKYVCKICGSKVRHDRPNIDSHVQSHFLSLAKYGQLYEKKIIEITERKRLKKEEKASTSSKVGTSHVEGASSSTSDIAPIAPINQASSSMSDIAVAVPNNQATETGNSERNILSKDEDNSVVKSPEKSQKETIGGSIEPELVENNNEASEASEHLADVVEKDQISFTIAEVNEVIHDLLSEEANKSSSQLPAPVSPPPGPAVLESDLLKSPFSKSDGEIYIYCCPFQGCHYTCNFQASVI